MQAAVEAAVAFGTGGIVSQQEWSFSYEEPLHEVFPALLDAQRAWLAQIESLQALDRKTHELVRMVVMVLARNGRGIRRHAQLATEVGATWDEIAAAVVLTEPGFGILAAVEAIPFARDGHDRGRRALEGEELDEDLDEEG
ncbi:MAG: carboxymuconolactone decarboxylase family protein [Acidimicrobiales bacterium]